MTRRYRVLDVFTETPLEGNPLAVVLDCDGLDDAAMLRIAGEFNLSETVFVVPPQDPANRAALRIFTRAMELPFAGHPTVGTAVLLALEDGVGEAPRRFVLEEKVGHVPCEVVRRGERVAVARFALPRLPQELGPAAPPAALAAALGLDAADIGCGRHRPTNFSAGTEFTYVPVRDRAALGRVSARPERWRAAFGDGSHAAAFVYTAGGAAADADFHARVFAPNMGIREDPATGSAAAAFLGVLQRFEQPDDGAHRWIVEQGFAMGRPSRLEASARIEAGRIVEAAVGGGAVVIAAGELAL